MSTPLRFGTAVSAAVLASMIAGCATTQVKTSFGGQAGENVGLATRALVALNAKNVPEAVNFAERAVEATPGDAGFRALLGNAYFAAGRFSSAATAYKDALTLYSNQPRVILKLALAETAIGRSDQAVAFLQAGQSVLDPSDYGLALALAGRPADAIPVLEAAARAPGADATVRQNLALAHALAGDWTEARTIASQDVPANELDSRIHQWMQLASPKRPSDQVAALVGVIPAATDPGEPVRFALSKTDTRMASAAPAPATPAPAPQPEVAEAAPVAPAPQFAEAIAAPVPAPQMAPAVAVAPPAPKSLIDQASSLASATTAMLVTAADKAEATVAAFLPKKAPAAKPKARHLAAAVRGNSGVVMQIGSYHSPQQVSAGWAHLTQRYPALRAYLPLKARFDSANGTFWRLSVQGFGNEREAIVRCNALKSRGGHCFVRGIAGDAPVEIASN
jgi:D-alanyl-D-alanine carboxypeptidase